MRKHEVGSYQEYADIQIHRSDVKWGSVTFDIDGFNKSIIKILNYISLCKEICCMGIRNGNEYFAFKFNQAFKEATVYGIDINKQVEKVGANCFCYDFSELPKEWEEKFDLIYSNSIDHAYDITKTLNEWKRCLKKGGYLWNVFSSANKVTNSDIYSFGETDLPVLADGFEIIDTWGNRCDPIFNSLWRKK